MTHSHDASDPALAFVAAVNAREFDLLDRLVHARQYVIDDPFGTA
jgi:hypothetical protein